MGAVVAGLVVLGVAGWALKERLWEEWWLYNLENGDEEDKRIAAQSLGDLRSVRAVLPLLQELRRQCVEASETSLDHEAGETPEGKTVFVVDVERADSYQQPLVQIGEGALVQLIRALSDDDLVYSSLCAQCIWLIAAGQGLTAGLRQPRFYVPESCAPILGLLSKDPERSEELRDAAAEVLKQIEAADADAPR